jgi:methylenetetrahydrofolate dehydrogenase (NADP+)/methenyltetrahydrofolate cyclohydrolase
MKILDGKKLNSEIRVQLKKQIDDFMSQGFKAPKLVILQIGNNPASNIYIKRKFELAQSIGALCEILNFPEDVSETEIFQTIENKNQDQDVHGIILQLPIPKHLNKRNIINAIKSEKDVDGLTESNLGKLINNDSSAIVPATARGICTLLKNNEIDIDGKNILVIGRSVLVGKTTAIFLLNQNATVTVAHSHTKNLDELIAKNEIIISATGVHGLINNETILENKIFVDVGITVINDKMVGDSSVVEYEQTKIKALSPVPGGVGPMTVVSLFENLLQAYQIKK